MPDGTTSSLTLTATTSTTPAAGEFTIGANTAATATNLQTALSTAVGKLANTELVAASAFAASDNFFNASPPLRVSGAPFNTATSLVAGTSANSVQWYKGETGSDPARGTAVARVDQGRGVIILTDLFGGTPSNISLSFMKEGKIEVVTGVNLPMLLKVSDVKEGTSLNEFARFIKEYGKNNISLASEILSKKATG